MGSFKSAAARTANQRTITSADRPAAVMGVNPDDGLPMVLVPEVPADQWLAEGESLTYWTQLPHGAAADIADAATEAVVAPGSNRASRRAARMSAMYHPGKAALATFVLGIVDFNLRDENDQPVKVELPAVGSEGWELRAKAFMSGLPAPLVEWLQEHIGADAPDSLGSLAPDAEHDDDTVGNASGAN